MLPRDRLEKTPVWGRAREWVPNKPTELPKTNGPRALSRGPRFLKCFPQRLFLCFCYNASVRIITFDIETSNQFSEVGSNDPTKLDISVVGIHDSETNELQAFFVHEFSQLWKVIESADALVGYNSDHFDIPLLNKYYPGDLMRIKSIDILKEIHGALGRRVKLDAVAEGTLKERKSGHGLDAIKWWRAGEKEKVRDYCLKDVEITRKVFDYALKNGSLKFTELGKTKEVKLDTRHWLTQKRSALTHTLGF